MCITRRIFNEPVSKCHPDVLRYAWQLHKDGRAEETVVTNARRLNRLAQLCTINEPEQVKVTLASLSWKNSTKTNVTNMLNGYYSFMQIKWTPPTYTKANPLYFIPTEQELDVLIAAALPKLSAFLQTLKETGIRLGEAANLKWLDLDTQRKTLYIHAEKGSNDRILPISDRLISMLGAFPKKNEKIFGVSKSALRTCFDKLRARTAKKLNNPRLKAIHLHTFRHWKGTMEYHKTHDIMHVKHVLGHKSIQATMVYINLEQSIFTTSSDEWTSIVTHNLEEEQKAINSGFELVRALSDSTALYRKRK